MRKKITIAISVLGVVTVALFGLYNFAKDRKFNTDAPPARFDPPRDQAEARARDLTQLALFFDLEKSFTPQTRAEGEALFRELEAKAPKLTDAEFDLAVARIVAIPDNGHTKVREYARTPRYNRLPIRGYWFADGYYVIRAYKGNEVYLGRRVVSIEGQPFNEAADALRQYIGGNEGTFRKYAPYIMESPQLMNAAGLSARPDAMTMELEDAKGNIETVTFGEPFPFSEDQLARNYYLLSPDIYKISQPDWNTISFEGNAKPLYLAAATEQFQAIDIPDMGAFYVQFWTNSDVGDQSIAKFCQGALKAYRASDAKTLIVDHRFNGGGNYQKTAKCMEGFSKTAKKGGRLYIINGGATFSAGLYSAAIVKHYGGEKAYFVGEDVGGRVASWAEDNLLVLPNSGIEIKFSTGFHNLRDGCTDWSICEWSSIGHPLRTESFEPDIPAPLTFADYASGRDPALEAIKVFETRQMPGIP